MQSSGHFTATAISVVAALLATWFLARIAPRIGLVDRPGGRKDHALPVPVIGGLALVATLLVGEFAFGRAAIPPSFLAAAIILVAISVWDDWKELHHLPRFVGQAVAVLVMVYAGGVQLASVGDLLGWRPIGLGFLGVPLTVFAVVGVINAVNMIDGMDGLAGSLALVALGWYGVAATLTGDAGLAALAWFLCGGLAGFLVFNLRLPWQPKARVFLGDAGSTLLGFALAWFAIDLSQGSGPAMPPIAALWVVLLPLADTVSLIARRRSRGRSPFHADREHIHHFLLARGLSVNATLLVLVGVSAVFGAVGVLGWRAGVPEPVLFWAFFFLFFGYHYAIKAAWRRSRAAGEA
jgi:UDP-GlcNAc:undecaprenyl-phosphate GlcNAc-1-phosphate transferase